MDTKISVIIPTYKPERYLLDCLKSLEHQTFAKNDFEVIIVVNGPREPYYGEISDFIKDFKCNFKIFYTDICGVSNARNLGIDKSRGVYLTFIDDDDYISPCFLEELYKHASKDIISISNSQDFSDKSGEDIICENQSQAYKKFSVKGVQRYEKIRSFFSGPWMKLIHRDIIGDRRFDVRFKNGEDALFNFLISNRFKFVDFTSPEAVYYKRSREGSALANLKFNQYIFKNTVALIKEYTQIYFSDKSYSFTFYSTRVLGALHTLLVAIRPTKKK